MGVSRLAGSVKVVQQATVHKRVAQRNYCCGSSERNQVIVCLSIN